MPVIMVSLVYRCPRIGLKVQGWVSDDPTNNEVYDPVTCIACGRVHLINPKTGKILEPGLGLIIA